MPSAREPGDGSQSNRLLTPVPFDVPGRRAGFQPSLRLRPGPFAQSWQRRIAEVNAAAAALWRRDPSVWSGDQAVQQTIANRLGWLSSPSLMADAIDRLQALRSGVKRDGFTDVVLLGMGGSSLAPEVLHAIVGVNPGWPELHIVDSTDPAAIQAASTPPATTLYLLASKSGTTIEPNSLAAFFRARLEAAGLPWARHFIAITDAGTELEERARSDGFRDVFINPSDIGGRYSAISYFGLVPAALMGQDLPEIIGDSLGMLAAAESPIDAASPNPATSLGLAIGAAAAEGRDKLTLIVPWMLEPFGLWVEQLVAESTGKQGTGVIPIAGEPPAPADRYSGDRLFVRLRYVRPINDGDFDERDDTALVEQLDARGAPVVEIDWLQPTSLGAEFVRWEIATAIAGAMLKINPFDEPNVQQAKDATAKLLSHYRVEQRLPSACADFALPGGIALAASAAARQHFGDAGPDSILTLIGEHDYFALLAYVGPDDEIANELQALRAAVRDRTRAATMFGYGPRYLHSTGQLHKGGPNTGVFVIVTADPVEDLAIPGEAFTFGTLEMAQALGDFNSLDAAGRRAVHVHLPRPDARLIRQVAEAMLAHL